MDITQGHSGGTISHFAPRDSTTFRFAGHEVRRSGVPHDAAYAGYKPPRRLSGAGWNGDGQDVLMPSADRRSEKRSAEGRGPLPPPFVKPLAAPVVDHITKTICQHG